MFSGVSLFFKSAIEFPLVQGLVLVGSVDRNQFILVRVVGLLAQCASVWVTINLLVNVRRMLWNVSNVRFYVVLTIYLAFGGVITYVVFRGVLAFYLSNA